MTLKDSKSSYCLKHKQTVSLQLDKVKTLLVNISACMDKALIINCVKAEGKLIQAICRYVTLYRQCSKS